MDGAHGVVNFSSEDQQVAAVYLGIPLEELRARYINGHDSIDLGDAPCTFLDPETNHCVIHPAKPAGCKLWPRTNLEQHQKRCPGIRE